MRRTFSYSWVLLSALGGCSDDTPPSAPIDIESMFGPVVLDPTGNTPLAAEVPFYPRGYLGVSIRVQPKGEQGVDTTWNLQISGGAKEVRIPILGLYAGHMNNVSISIVDKRGNSLGTKEFAIKTEDLPNDFPSFSATGSHESNWFTFMEFLRTPLSRAEGFAIMVDSTGQVRWYSTFAIPDLHPAEIIDGTLFASDRKDLLLRYDFLGHELLRLDLSQHGYEHVHHDIFKKSDGNFLLTVNRVGAFFIEDCVIELRLEDNNLRARWNLADTFPDLADLFLDLPMTSGDEPGVTNDPVHANSVWHDDVDGTLIVSSQRTGLAELYRSGQLKWLLAPHLIRYIDDSNGDGVSDSFADGYDPDRRLTWTSDFHDEAFRDERYPVNGKPTADYSTFEFNYGEFLLAPLDASGAPIEDEDVRLGFKDHPEFAWPFRAHSVMLTSQGTVLVFDNGLTRNFGLPFGPSAFSRAVEYEVTEDTSDGYGGTVRQVWQYWVPGSPPWHGFSPLVGDVDELPNGNRLVTSGAIGSSFVTDSPLGNYGDGPVGALVIEVDPSDNREVHSLRVDRLVDDNHPPTEFTAYRAERINPYDYWLNTPLGAQP